MGCGEQLCTRGKIGWGQAGNIPERRRALGVKAQMRKHWPKKCSWSSKILFMDLVHSANLGQGLYPQRRSTRGAVVNTKGEGFTNNFLNYCCLRL
jgi:hypothetical protein